MSGYRACGGMASVVGGPVVRGGSEGGVAEARAGAAWVTAPVVEMAEDAWRRRSVALWRHRLDERWGGLPGRL